MSNELKTGWLSPKPYFEDNVFPMGSIVRTRWERENDIQ